MTSIVFLPPHTLPRNPLIQLPILEFGLVLDSGCRDTLINDHFPGLLTAKKPRSRLLFCHQYNAWSRFKFSRSFSPSVRWPVINTTYIFCHTIFMNRKRIFFYAWKIKNLFKYGIAFSLSVLFIYIASLNSILCSSRERIQ